MGDGKGRSWRSGRHPCSTAHTPWNFVNQIVFYRKSLVGRHHVFSDYFQFSVLKIGLSLSYLKTLTSKAISVKPFGRIEWKSNLKHLSLVVSKLLRQKTQASLVLNLPRVSGSPEGLEKTWISRPTHRDCDLVDLNGGPKIHISNKHYSRWCWCCLSGDLTWRSTALAHLPCPFLRRRSTRLLINPSYYSGLMGYDPRQQVSTMPRHAASKIRHGVMKKRKWGKTYI